jgi:hypothetical protein
MTCSKRYMSNRSCNNLFNFCRMQVIIKRGQCHWYYYKKNNDEKLFKCKSNAKRPHKGNQRIAIVVAGGITRYQMNSTLQHLIRPLTNQGHQVDYFLSLSMTSMPAYRSDQGYMNHLAQDPLLPTNTSGDETQPFIENEIMKAGGRPRHVLCAPAVNIDSNPLVRAKREAALTEHPREDPDTRFPLLDLRSTAKSRTANANRNMLTLFYNVQTVWKQVVKAELVDGQKYDHVMFFRDDAMWLDDFDFDRLVTRGGDMTDLYTLSCDARKPSMHPLEMNDHGVVVSRSKANLFGDYFDLLFEDDIQKCNEQLGDNFRKEGRGCNSEMIMKWILKNRNVVTETVGQGMLPFQRSVHVKMPGGEVQPCFHKFCRSHADPLDDFGVKQCKTLF